MLWFRNQNNYPMQFLDRFLAAVVSTPRPLKWSQTLGMVAAASLVLPTTAQSISGTFQCQSIVINFATGPNNLAVGFTTPSSTAGGNPQLPLNGEFEYYPGNINLYQSYWIMYQGNQLADLGLVGIGGSSLQTNDRKRGFISHQLPVATPLRARMFGRHPEGGFTQPQNHATGAPVGHPTRSATGLSTPFSGGTRGST